MDVIALTGTVMEVRTRPMPGEAHPAMLLWLADVDVLATLSGASTFDARLHLGLVSEPSGGHPAYMPSARLLLVGPLLAELPADGGDPRALYVEPWQVSTRTVIGAAEQLGGTFMSIN